MQIYLISLRKKNIKSISGELKIGLKNFWCKNLLDLGKNSYKSLPIYKYNILTGISPKKIVEKEELGWKIS